MEPPEVLAIHAVPHPNPKVRRVGFTLDDPSVEQVWAGVIGPSALLVLRRLPALWCESEPAVVDMRELGQSLGLGRSLARSGRTWRTIERIVGFGIWPTGCRATSSAYAPRWRPSKPASSPDYPSGPARSTTSCSALDLDQLALGHTDRALDPDWSLDTARITARLDHLQHRRPAITRGVGLQPTMTVPPPPDVARSSSTAVPRRRPAPTDPARTPLQVPLRGTCLPSPEREAVSTLWSIRTGVPGGWRDGRSSCCADRGRLAGGRVAGARVQGSFGVSQPVAAGQVGGSGAVVDVFDVERFAALVDQQATTPSAAIGSAHHQPSMALSTSPASTTADSQAQARVCALSASAAWLCSAWATCRCVVQAGA
jgi:hypothetical protein